MRHFKNLNAMRQKCMSGQTFEQTIVMYFAVFFLTRRHEMCIKILSHKLQNIMFSKIIFKNFTRDSEQRFFKTLILIAILWILNK